ncbi:MAG: sulfatase modifying factor 1 [Pirellulaceae bacterium]|jgi:sulfatase modifying factor 1
MKKYTTLFLVAIFGFVTAVFVSPVCAVDGLTDKKPAKGPFVKTDKGYMIPYTVTIPNGDSATFDMLPIPGGTFKMGAPQGEKGATAAEGPQIEVTVEPFWMAKTEVTWVEYKIFMSLYASFKDFQSKKLRIVNEKNIVDAITAPTELYEPTFTFEFGEDPKLPAITLTQYAAKQYSKWMSGILGHQYRLPLDAEWEFACRGGTKTAYHFGDDPADLGDYAWHEGNSDETPHFVAQKKPNQFGLYDMHGNVAEWVLDEYQETGYKFLAGKTWKAIDTFRMPTKQFPRPVRGGHWGATAEACRSSSRLGSHDDDWKEYDPNIPLSPWWYTNDPARGVGMRLIRPLNEMSQAEIRKLKFYEADVEDILLDVENRILEGRGVYGIVDKELPAAIKKLDE